MKCKLCGYEVEPGVVKCPNCGSRVGLSDNAAAFSDGEMSWNTRDFPKPKKMSDIEMSWPDIRSHTVSISEDEIKEALDKKEPVTVMADDGSEGYVSKPQEEPAPKAKEEPAPAPVAEEPKAHPASITIKSSPELSKGTQDQIPPFWYTQKFTATGIMQTGPAWPVAPGETKPGYPATATIETMTLSDPVPIMPQIAAAAAAEAAKKQASETAPSSFTVEDILEEFKGPAAKPEAKSEEHFYTFQKKNDEFQKLLDMEYDRFHAFHGEDADPMKGATIHSFVPEETVRAKDLSTFEKMLLDSEPVKAEETPAQKFFSQAPEFPAEKKDEPQPAAADQAAKAEPAAAEDAKPAQSEAAKPAEAEKEGAKPAEETKDPELGLFVIPSGDPSKYNIDEIEHTIRELQAQEVIAENNRSERKKRLAAMAAAREAYFKSLDDMEAERKSRLARTEDRLSSMFGGKKSEETADLAKAEPEAPKAEPAKAAEPEAPKAEPAAAAEPEAPKAEPAAAEAPKAEPAAAEADKPQHSVEDASPVDIWDDPDAEPTKEIPVGSILKALAAGGTVAAAEAAVEKKVADKLARTAALSRGETPTITEDLSRTRVYRNLAEQAEELARRYEQPQAPAKDDDPIAALIKKYEGAKTEAPAAPAFEEPAFAKAEPEAPKAAPAPAKAEDSFFVKAEEPEDAEEPKAEPAFAAFEAPKAAEPEAPKAIEPERPEDIKPAEAEEPEKAASAAPAAGAAVAVASAAIAAALKAASEKKEEAAETVQAAAIGAAEAAKPAAVYEEPAKAEPYAEPAKAEPAKADAAEEDASASALDALDEALSKPAEVEEPTHPFDASLVAQSEEDEDDDDDEDEERPRHVILKIIAVILIICALFEGVVLGLKHFAPEAPITGSAVQIEEAVGEAIMSFVNTVVDGVGRVFGGGR